MIAPEMINSTNSKKRSKGGKVMKIVLATFRVLGKANALYMKSMEKVSGGLGVSPTPQYQHVKVQNFSRSQSVGFSEPDVKQTRGESSGMKIRSYSVGVGKIGTIDEERPCSFRALEGNDLLFYPTSRICVVKKSSTQH